MARRVAREDGIFAGGSTGVNVVAALSAARALPPEAVVLALVCDTGERYLSKQWNDDWMRDNQLLEEPATLTAAGILRQRARETEALVSVPADATVRDGIELMRQRDLSQLPVKRDGKLYPEHDLFIQLMKLKNTLRFIKGEDLITHIGLEYYD